MKTSTIIILAVVAALILVALLVLLPRMRKAAAVKKAENERRDRERRLERERQEKADEHRSVAERERSRAELAEAEAQRARAEAEINAKRAELHEQGLADDELPAGREIRERGEGVGDGVVGDRGFREVSGGRAHEPVDEGSRSPDFERGREVGHEETEGSRFTRTDGPERR